MQISVDELESSISVKISKEAVMSINSPESLFTSVNGKLETKVYIAGLPNRTDNVIKPVRPKSIHTQLNHNRYALVSTREHPHCCTPSRSTLGLTAASGAGT